MLEYFDRMVSTFEARLAKHANSPAARLRFGLEVARLTQRLYAKENPLAWCGVCVPFDLLSAMGVTSCFIEFVGGLLSSTGEVGPFLEQSEHEGFLPDGCGFHRAVLGASAMGLIPVPDMVIGSSRPCSGGIAAVEHLAAKFDRPFFVVNIPADDSDSSVKYLADQFRRMVEFVEGITGRKLDDNALREAMIKTNQARAYMVEAYELAKRIPSPVNSGELRNFGIVIPLFLGTDAAVNVCRAYRDEFAARVERGAGGVPEGERLRLLWLQEAIQFKNPLVKMLEKDYQAAVVVDELNDVFWDPVDLDDPYSSLARRTIAMPFNGSYERRMNHIKKLAEDYKVDAAVNPCHWGCRQGSGARGLIQDELKALDIPVINLEVDCVDSRNFAEGQLRTRLEAFMELLGTRKAAAGR